MSETGGPVLEGGGESSESALDALFFVVIALFLGESAVEIVRSSCHAATVMLKNGIYAGIFTKQALAWTRIPFTALLLVNTSFDLSLP